MIKECPYCHGSGKPDRIDGKHDFIKVCTTCQGKGEIETDKLLIDEISRILVNGTIAYVKVDKTKIDINNSYIECYGGNLDKLKEYLEKQEIPFKYNTEDLQKIEKICISSEYFIIPIHY